MRQNSRIIGLTGNIASGKSTAVGYLIEKGYPIVDADKISHSVTKFGEEGYIAVVNHFSSNILSADLSIDRDKLGHIVFNNPEELGVLNNILHPIIREKIKSTIEFFLEEYPVVIVDVPLLFEVLEDLNDAGIIFDEIWMIYVDEKEQIKRLMKRDGIAENFAIKKIKSQMSSKEKCEKADYVLDNNGNLETLFQQIDRGLERLDIEVK
ncbi:MAG: dephospho-CoA kinase [Tissierellales bacterium]|jgi:dephospho-CoA kinase|nr:dephospho-CoA kinase [Tissierellales bacterium]